MASVWRLVSSMESLSSVYASLCEGNGSEGNTTSDLWLVEDRTSGLVTAAFLLLFLVIGLPWNLLVIVTIVKQRLYTQPTIILLLNLVVTDIVLLVLYVPFSIATGFKGEYILGDSDEMRCATCRLGCITILFYSSSISTLSLMSFDRFLFIYKALQYERLITKWRTVVAIAVVWVVATVIAILPVLGFGNTVYHPGFTACVIDTAIPSSHYAIVALIGLLVPVILIVVCNIWVCCIVRKNIHSIYTIRKSMKLAGKSTQESSEVSSSRRVTKKRHEKELHLVKVFGLLLLTEILSNLPLIVVVLRDISSSGPRVPTPIITAVHILFVSQASLHPIIETHLIKELREPLKRLLFYSCTRIKSKVGAHTGSVSSSPNSRQAIKNSHHGNQSTNPPDCCVCGYLDVCRAAILFHHHPHSTTEESGGEVNGRRHSERIGAEQRGSKDFALTINVHH